MLHSRVEQFNVTIMVTFTFLRQIWPPLEGVTVLIAQAPAEAIHDDHIDRWKVYPGPRQIVFFRLPMMLFLHTHNDNELEARSFVESCVLRAAAELLGREPWELAPDQYRPY